MKVYELIHEMQNTASVFGRSSDVRVIFEGDQAKTDGKEIVLPALPQQADLTHDQAMVFRGYLDHEAGHVKYTDFEQVQLLGQTGSDAAFTLANCIEDIYLEDKVMDFYPGSKKNLTKMWEAVCEEGEEAFKTRPIDYSKPNLQAVVSAILSAGRLDYGGDLNRKHFEAMPAKYQEWGLKWADLARKSSGTKENINIALEIEKLLEKTPPNTDMSKPQEDEGQGEPQEGLGGDPNSFTYDPNGDVTQGKEPKKGQSRQAKDKGQPKEGQDGITKFMEDWVKSTADEYFDANKGEKSTRYTVLTDRYDEVIERDKTPKFKSGVHNAMVSSNAVDYEKLRSSIGGVVNTMKAKLRRALMAKERRDWDFGREQGRLDSKRLVAGYLGSPTVYKERKDRQEEDTAILVLVDLSGSMGGTKIETAAKSAIAFAECLEGTKLRYAIAGFSNYGTYAEDLVQQARRGNRSYERVDSLKIHLFKRFSESLQAAKGAVAAIADAAGGCNSDRDAVIWAMNTLAARPEKRKVLLVLSDGQPANSTINSNVNLTYALKNAILDAPKKNIECVGIGIQDRTVLDIYPKAVSINRVEDLAGVMFTQLSNLLTGGKVNL